MNHKKNTHTLTMATVETFPPTNIAGSADTIAVLPAYAHGHHRMDWSKTFVPTDLFQSDQAHITWAKFLHKNGLLQKWVLDKMKFDKDPLFYQEHVGLSSDAIKMHHRCRPAIGHNGGILIHMRNQIDYSVKGLGRVRHTFMTMCANNDRDDVKYIYDHAFKLVSALPEDME